MKLDPKYSPHAGNRQEEAAPSRGSFRDLTAPVDTVPGIAALAATSILSETGTGMSRFASDGHLLSWAGPSPSKNESVGKRKSSRLRKGTPWLNTLLVQCAWAAIKK